MHKPKKINMAFYKPYSYSNLELVIEKIKNYTDDELLELLNSDWYYKMAIAHVGSKFVLDKLLQWFQDISITSVIISRGFKEHVDEVISYFPYETIYYSLFRDNKIDFTEEQLDILVKHKNYRIRERVANLRISKYIDLLLYDENENVRITCVYGTNEEQAIKMVSDSSNKVRKAIAYRGHLKACELLFNDSDTEVVKIAKESVERVNLRLIKKHFKGE